ncbi:MAG: mechanosensitive ion channel family protein [Pseudomonadota bacterium]
MSMDQIIEFLKRWSDESPLMAAGLGLLLLAILAIIVHRITRILLVQGMKRLAAQTKSHWDDELVGHGIFRNLSHVIPAFIIYASVDWFDRVPVEILTIIERVSVGYGILFVVLAIGALLNALSALYQKRPAAKERPLKGFFQIAKIVIYCVGAVLVIAAVFDRSPLLLFSGLGALTAVLILVFKDTLMSLVASVQIASTGILRIGDWVEMPQYGADGDVIDIALHTVSVQNWDKTVTTIPTHRFISDSFRNWRFMSLSGGRRIKRALNIDLGTVRFLSPTEVDRFREFALLRDYIDEKRESLRAANADIVDDGNVNARRLTNLGTFRAYMVAYLRSHPGINKAMTQIVRQLDPSPHGIPLELYAFTGSTEWVEHERVKSDVFDHLIAIARHFDLKVFQSPTGNDITGLGENLPKS